MRPARNPLFEPGGLHAADGEGQDFRIRLRGTVPEMLDAGLAELVGAAGLIFFMPEYVCNIKKTLATFVVAHPRHDHARQGRGHLAPHHECAVVAAEEFDALGRRARAAQFKGISVFEGGSHRLIVAPGHEIVGDACFHFSLHPGFARQYIFRPVRDLQQIGCHSSGSPSFRSSGITLR